MNLLRSTGCAALLILFLLASQHLCSQQVGAAQHVTLITAPADALEQRYADFLQRSLEAQGITVDLTAHAGQNSGSGSTVVLGTVAQMPALLSSPQLQQWRHASPPKGPEGFSAVPLSDRAHTVVVLASAEHGRGELFAIGWLLRTEQHTAQGLILPREPAFRTSPDREVRGYQVGYRMKNNTYDAWAVQQFQQQMLDLAVFGMNTMQVIAPFSDDAATSPLFPAPAEATVINLSRISQEYGLRFDLYYPEMGKDYGDPAQVAAEIKQFEALVRQLPLVDSLHVPGGDPGHTRPDLLFPLVQQEAVILHRYHPQAKVWISAQGFNAENYQRFYTLLRAQPSFLDGVFFGPQSRESMEQQRAAIPSRYPLEFYPDTAHTMHAQFPIPDWDPIYALTEGREPIDPRPAAFAHIYRHFHPFNSGAIVYSEGVNDDINKVLWGALGWNAATPADQILREYAGYFFAADPTEQTRIAAAIHGLEQNWDGPLLRNRHIEVTLQQLQDLHPKRSAENWRWDSLLYRGSYDRYVQLKRQRELEAQTQALKRLASTTLASRHRIEEAQATLQATRPGAEEQQLHDRLEQLAGALFHECGLQLSVKRYGASNWERGANLDRIDTPLNDRVWLTQQLKRVETMNPTDQASGLAAITRWQKPPAGGFYDDLGDPQNEPHLVRGEGWEKDPELYHTAINGVADKTLADGWRLSWLDYAETLYEQPLQLRYSGLPAGTAYTLRVTYAGEDYVLPMRLDANGTELQAFRKRASNPEQRDYTVPASLIHAGALQLSWTRAFGAGGGGRGGQVAEVWLLPNR